MALKLRVWLLAALVLLAAVVLPALAQDAGGDAAISGDNPAVNGETNAADDASSSSEAAEESSEEASGDVPGTESSGVGEVDSSEDGGEESSSSSDDDAAAAAAADAAAAESSSEEAAAEPAEESEESGGDASGGVSSSEEVPPSEESSADAGGASDGDESSGSEVIESDADEEFLSGSDAVDSGSDDQGPGTEPASGSDEGGDEGSSDEGSSDEGSSIEAEESEQEPSGETSPGSVETPGQSGADGEGSSDDGSGDEGGMDVSPDDEVDPTAGQEEAGPSNATARVEALTRDGTPPPHPTVRYDNRTEYQGFEYAGPVVHARHAVLETSAKCGLFGNPSTTFTFDNRAFAFRGLGAFVLTRSRNSSEEVQALQTRTPMPQALPRTVGVSVRAPGGQVLQVRLARSPGTPAAEASLRPYVTLQGKDITADIQNQPRVDTEAFGLTRDGVFGAASGKPMILAVRVSESGTTVAITFERSVGVNHMNVFVEADGSRIGLYEGLCGNYDFNPGNDVVTTGTGGVPVASGWRTGAAWAVTKESAALFEGYRVPSEDAVVPEPLQPAHLHATAADTAAAEKACAGVRKDFTKACVMAALVAGAEGVAEVKNTQDILLEDSIVASANITACMQAFFVGPWTQYSKCNAPCGEGSSNRTREVFNGKTREQCGTFTQYRKCTTRCEHANVPGKCAVYGDPHVVTFDQRMYDFRGVGEYVMYHSLDDKEQVNLVFDRTITNTTSQVSWVTGVAFRAGPDVLSMHLTDAGDDFCSFRYNGRALGGLSRNTSYYGLFTVRRTGALAGPGRASLMVEVSAPGGTTVTAAFYNFNAGRAALINAFVEVGGQRLKDTQGLCGSFDLDPKNDLTDVNGKGVKPREFAWGWGVARNRTLFTDPTPALALPASRLPVAPRLIGANGTYDRAVNACQVMPQQLRDACVLDYVTLGPEALQMMKDVDAVVEEDKIEVEYVARGCLVKEGSYLGPWGDWSECSRECGGGEMTRARGVFAYNSERCGAESEKRMCNNHPCPIDCVVGAWRHWSECSVTCGNGTETRTRGIVVPTKFGGEHCPPLHEERACERLPCCEVGEWDSFSECRPDGTKIRRREVNFPARCGKTTDVAPCCYADPWPVSSNTVNGTGTKGIGGEPLWSECKDGEQVRRRRVFPEHCAEDTQRRPCCDTGRWSKWGQCVDGAQTRWRTVSPSNCSHSSETRVCCTQYAWSGWSECAAGKRNRTRNVVPTGCDVTHETEDCCTFGNWTADNVTGCVKGEQKWTRLVEPSSCGKAEEKRECCSWDDWADWEECVGGKQSRERVVYGPDGCAPANETRACGDDKAHKDEVAKEVAKQVAEKVAQQCGCAKCPCAAVPKPCACETCPCQQQAAAASSARTVLDGVVRPNTVKAGVLKPQQ